MPDTPLDLAAAADPVAAFRAAHASGRLLSLATSGTTSRPRSVLRTTDSWVDSFDHVSRLAGIEADSRVWIPGPVTATMNLFALVHTDWAGARVVEDLADATHAHLTPARLARLLVERPADVAGVHFITAGDRLERSAYDAVVAAGARASHYYGAAELSFVAWGEHADALAPFPGVEIEIRDPATGAPLVATGAPAVGPASGEIWVRSPYLCREGPSPTPSGGLSGAESGVVGHRVGGWRTVGDRGALVDGHLVVHGREGGIITAGATVLVADVEAELRTVTEVVVLGLPHPDLGEVVAAVLTDPDALDAARQHARGDLPAAHRPRRWFWLEALPLTDNGKVDRRATRDAVLSGAARSLV